MTKFYAFLLISFSLFCTALNAQTLKRCDSTSAVWVCTQDSSIIAVKIKGHTQPTETRNILSVEDFALQCTMSDKKKFVPMEMEYKDMNVLIAFALRETKSLSTDFGTQLNTQVQQVELPDKRSALIWFYAMPPTISTEVNNQVYINVIVGNKIFGLSCPQFKDQKFETVRDFLLEVMGTVKSLTKKEAQNPCG